APCFLVGVDTIVLPAFSLNAAGLDVATARLPGPLRGKALNCLVSAGDTVLDFGQARDVARRMSDRLRSPECR
ncbi:MAG TPA: hypothetical protein VGY53_08840, partial [Isosphaeraceae bacterium]|nr:hypothetical protein [Isosphaeraceae bacterium]